MSCALNYFIRKRDEIKFVDIQDLKNDIENLLTQIDTLSNQKIAFLKFWKGNSPPESPTKPSYSERSFKYEVLSYEVESKYDEKISELEQQLFDKKEVLDKCLESNKELEILEYMIVDIENLLNPEKMLTCEHNDDGCNGLSTVDLKIRKTDFKVNLKNKVL